MNGLSLSPGGRPRGATRAKGRGEDSRSLGGPNEKLLRDYLKGRGRLLLPGCLPQPRLADLPAGTDFSKPEIDRFVMAITAAEAKVRHIGPHQTA